MKPNFKVRITILVIIGLFLFLSSLTCINPYFKTENDKNKGYTEEFISKNIKSSISSAVSGVIHIDNNWTEAKGIGICTGEGTYFNPYVIQDWVIDGSGIGACILIENSDVYFRLENCTVFNSGKSSLGINLYNVNNSQITNNNCSTKYNGINLFYSNNNTISGNTANGIPYSDGIYLFHSDYNIISGNAANNCSRDGIHIDCSKYNTFIDNEMNECGLGLDTYLLGPIEDLSSHNIDTTNLVNGKPLYYYANEVNLGSDNFTNAGQVILVNCNESLISNLKTSIGISLRSSNDNIITYNDDGIYLENSDDNLISENTARIDLENSDNNNILDNAFYKDTGGWTGISLAYSYNNAITGNIANSNSYGIKLRYSNNNIITENRANYNHLGIFLFHSVENLISGNILNKNLIGIGIYYDSDKNTISRNTANNNDECGIYLFDSDHNIISGNTLEGNEICIKELACRNNIFFNNGSCFYRNILFQIIPLLSIVGIGIVIAILTTSLIKTKRKKAL